MNLLKRLFKKTPTWAPDYDSLSLCELVFLTVDSPSQIISNALIKRLSTSKVYAIPTPQFLVNEISGNIEPLLRQKAPDGNIYYVIFCDFNTIRKEYPNETVVEFPGAIVMQIAHSERLPIAIRANRGSKKPYTVIPIASLDVIYKTISKYEGSYDYRIYNSY
ncbi:MAG: hypothetical protein WCI71_19995 [Bacteroidota bacterium]